MIYVATTGAASHACNCVGPQNGEPRCPCMMRGLEKRGDRWVQPERDLGPVQPIPGVAVSRTHGCVCPAGAERTCQGPMCPRKPIGPAA